MGFSIKYTNGKRELEAVPIVKTTNLVADFIEALKSLRIKAEMNFKFENLPVEIQDQEQLATSPLPAANSIEQESRPKPSVSTTASPAPSDLPMRANPVVSTQTPSSSMERQERTIPAVPAPSVPLPRREAPKQAPIVLTKQENSQPFKPKPATVSPPMQETPKPLVSTPAPSVQAVQREEPKPVSSIPAPLLPVSSTSRSYDGPVSSDRRRLGKPLVQDVLVYGKLPIGTCISTIPISVDDSFSPPAVHIAYDYNKLGDLTEKITALESQIERQPMIDLPKIGQIVLARSQDDQKYYRAIIESLQEDKVKVLFFDWGLRELVEKEDIKCLIYPELNVSREPACAVTVRFTNQDKEMINRVLEQVDSHNMRIESLIEGDNVYALTILD